MKHADLLEWFRLEWAYQLEKFDREHDVAHTRALLDTTRPDEWKGYIDNYYQQAMLLGIQNPRGRQRLAKAVATMIAELFQVTEMFGDLPEPGHSSTDDLVEWKRA